VSNSTRKGKQGAGGAPGGGREKTTKEKVKPPTILPAITLTGLNVLTVLTVIP
jgi:hypothetical protein